MTKNPKIRENLNITDKNSVNTKNPKRNYSAC